ncbi:MAG: hypothetical protein K8T10_07500 [Candidatus Eremiobacteraeota bacterium]|nr:hypothetical protein [Candidatus Eremiobacteraeota bacterium]
MSESCQTITDCKRKLQRRGKKTLKMLRKKLWELTHTKKGKLLFATAAIGAFAVGAMAYGVLAIGKMAVGDASFKKLSIDKLQVNHLKVKVLEIEKKI